MSSLQKKLAARILKVGISRIWLDPEHKKDVEAAITRIDVKNLIKKGYVKRKLAFLRRPKQLGREKRTTGKRKGSKFSIVSAKRKWISTVRPLRRTLKELKTSGQLDNREYRKLYLLVKGGAFRSRSHLKIYLEQHGLLKKR